MNPRLFRFGTLFGLAATLALLWLWALAADSRWLAIVGSLAVLPALPGLLRGTPYTHAWASMLALPYLAVAVVEAYANPPMRAYAFATLLASALWFLSCLLYVRGAAAERRAR